MFRRRQRGGFFRGSRRQRGGVYRGSRRQRGGGGGKRSTRRRRKLQKGGIIPALIPLIAAGITAAGGIGASAAHAAISRG